MTVEIATLKEAGLRAGRVSTLHEKLIMDDDEKRYVINLYYDMGGCDSYGSYMLYINISRMKADIAKNGIGGIIDEGRKPIICTKLKYHPKHFAKIIVPSPSYPLEMDTAYMHFPIKIVLVLNTQL